jgi:hypothetical protein
MRRKTTSRNPAYPDLYPPEYAATAIAAYEDGEMVIPYPHVQQAARQRRHYEQWATLWLGPAGEARPDPRRLKGILRQLEFRLKVNPPAVVIRKTSSAPRVRLIRAALEARLANRKEASHEPA